MTRILPHSTEIFSSASVLLGHVPTAPNQAKVEWVYNGSMGQSPSNPQIATNVGTRRCGYIAPINIRVGSAITGKPTIWTLGDSFGTLSIGTRIEKVYLRAFFDGVAAASIMKFSLNSYNSVKVTGTNTVVPVPKDTSDGAYPFTVWNDNPPNFQTLTPILFGPSRTVIINIQCGRVPPTTTQFTYSELTLDEDYWAGMGIIQTSALCINIETDPAVIGDNIQGYVEFSMWQNVA